LGGRFLPRLRVAGALDTVAAADEEIPLQLTPPPPQLSPELDEPISFLSYTSCIDSEGLQKGGRACVQLRVDNCCLPCLQVAVRPPSSPLQPMRGP
jgi:hypothetical protein